MALAKYDSSLAYDQIMQRGLPGRVVEVTDPDTGIPVEGLLDIDGQPIARLVSNSQGYVQPFMVEDGPPLVRVRIETVAYHLLDLSLLGEASLAAQQAAQAAIDAANLVGAPADTAIATAVNAAGSATRAALDSRYTTPAQNDAKYASKALATSAAAGLMAAADKAKLDAATNLPTASRVMQRDASGRAQVAAPVASSDIAPKSYVDTTATTAATLVQLLPNPGGGDLNTYTATGRYRQAANAAALVGTNYPAPFAGLLTVSADNPNMVFQTYQTYGASSANRLYWRANYNSEWQPWKEVADVASVAATVAGSLSSVVNTDELTASVLIPSFAGAFENISSGAINTLFIAPYDLRVTSLHVSFENLTIPASSSNYLTLTLRGFNPATGGRVIVAKSSADDAIAPRTPWLFDALAWNTANAIIPAGDMVNIGWGLTGSARLSLPMTVQIGYEPL